MEKIDLVKWVSAVAGSLLLWLSLVVLRKYFPWRERKPLGPQARLSEKEYKIAQVGFGVLFVVCLLLIGALLFQAYEWWSSATMAALPAGDGIIRPDPWGYWLSIGVLAVGAGGLLSSFLMNAFLGERSRLFIAEVNRRNRMNTWVVFVGLYTFILLLGGALALLFLQTSLRIETNRVVFNQFLTGDAKTYPISAITSISYGQYYRNRQGELRERPHYQMEFRDGFQWSTKQFPYAIENPGQYSELFQQLAARAGLKIEGED